MRRNRFYFDLVYEDSEDLQGISFGDLLRAVRSQMATELTPEQKRKVKVDTQITHNGHTHHAPRGEFCAYCDALSRDGKG